MSEHHWGNLFTITNQDDLRLKYRLLEIHDLPPGAHYDKCANQLVKAVRYEIRQPAVLLRRGDQHCLALPVEGPLPRLRQRLTPHVAELELLAGEYQLDFAHLTDEVIHLASEFLQFALGGPLFQSSSLWKYGRSYYAKTPLHPKQHPSIDVYPGFHWSVVADGDHRLFLSVDVTARYVDQRWWNEVKEEQQGTDLGFQRCLYHFGNQWYVIKAMTLTGRTIADQHFVPEDTGEAVSVYAYTQQKCGTRVPWIRDLDPTSPAILFRNDGNEQERYGALALAKRLRSTADVKGSPAHRASIQPPEERMPHIRAIVAQHFQRASLGGQAIQVATSPHVVERRVFPLPTLRFSNGRLLAAERRAAQVSTQVVPLEEYGRRRLQLALDPQAGPLDSRSFDPQCIVLPYTLPRAISEDFIKRYLAAMQQISGPVTYSAQLVYYDDRAARTLYQQITAIKEAIRKSGITHGYGLLVLPPRAQADLHNYVKRTFWPDVQFQCATAHKIKRFYSETAGWQPTLTTERKLESYVRNVAFGMLVVNRKWLWARQRPLHADVHIGVDVLHGMAGVCYIYRQGQEIIFQNFPSKYAERFTPAQMRTIIEDRLRDDLAALHFTPQSIVIHRDGRTWPSELQGLESAIKHLKRANILPPDVRVDVVDIRKSSASHLRLVAGQRGDTVANCVVGSYYLLNTEEGILCTTGAPFALPGTAHPLMVKRIVGETPLADILQDVFDLAQLAFTAPDKCVRLPATVKLANDFLEPIASDADEDEALYDEELADEEDVLYANPLSS